MKIKINILVFVLVVATFLGGCNMKKAFKNQEEDRNMCYLVWSKNMGKHL